jgi:hypothetical protein
VFPCNCGNIRTNHATLVIRKSWHYFVNKRLSLGRHSSLADQSLGVCFFFVIRGRSQCCWVPGLWTSSNVLKEHRKLDLFPSSGQRFKETSTQLGPLERPNHWHPILSPEDGNRSSFRNVVSYQNARRWMKSSNWAILSGSLFGCMSQQTLCAHGKKEKKKENKSWWRRKMVMIRCLKGKWKNGWNICPWRNLDRPTGPNFYQEIGKLYQYPQRLTKYEEYVFYNMTPSSLVEVYLRVVGIYCIHLQGKQSNLLSLLPAYSLTLKTEAISSSETSAN